MALANLATSVPSEQLPPDRLTDLFQQLPGEGIVLAGSVFVIGMLLWIVGSRVMRPGFTLLGAILGGGVGYLFADLVPGAFPSAVVAVVSAMICGIVAYLAFRGAMALFLAVLFGTAAPMGVWSWAEHRGLETFETAEVAPADSESNDAATEVQGFRERLEQHRDDLMDALDAELNGESPDTGDAATAKGEDPNRVITVWRDAARSALAEVYRSIKAHWDVAPTGLRWSLSVSAACGALFGLLIGLAAPTAGASLVTSMAGATMWLGAGWILLQRISSDARDLAPDSTAFWLILWAVAVLIGLVIQWTIRRRSADKPDSKNGGRG